MFIKNEFPILEFDESKTSKINPDSLNIGPLSSNRLVITFFSEVIDSLLKENQIELAHYISGESPITIYRYTDGSNVLITLGQLGCPACGGNLDLLSGQGINKVMFCGGGGVLDSKIKVGEVLLVDGAIRDDGFSYHYLKAGRIVEANKELNNKIASYLNENNVPFLRGLVWTTDAIFRETQDRILARKEEGAKIVEMEQSGCLAVAKYRGFDYAALIYGGDNCDSEEWDNRGWRSNKGMRFDLTALCKKLVEII